MAFWPWTPASSRRTCIGRGSTARIHIAYSCPLGANILWLIKALRTYEQDRLDEHIPSNLPFGCLDSYSFQKLYSGEKISTLIQHFKSEQLVFGGDLLPFEILNISNMQIWFWIETTGAHTLKTNFIFQVQVLKLSKISWLLVGAIQTCALQTSMINLFFIIRKLRETILYSKLNVNQSQNFWLDGSI